MARESRAMPMVSFTIEPGQKAFIEDLAARLDVPQSRIFREAIRRFMSDPNHNLHMQTADNSVVAVENVTGDVESERVAD
jgi:hypothetical protein